jgi:murein L,D-transpeptidase YcbB/YkuD
MASAVVIANFIKEIAPCAQYAYKTLGKVKPSVCIAMACVESAYGTSNIMRKNNAFLGQKTGTGKTATKYWNKTFFTSKTKEEYIIGQHVVIKDSFRSYQSMLQCVLNYYELLNTSLYSKVKSDADYITQMQQIKQCGYMTSSTEVNSVIKLIQAYELYKYDLVTSGNDEVNPYKLSASVMKVGSRNESVKWLQFELNKLGYNLAVDGSYGNKTKNAVIDYQKTHGLVQDGICGRLTINSLKGI